jgi:hypothetical protein
LTIILFISLIQIDLENYILDHNDTRERGTSSILSTPSVIVPDYSTAPPYFSASVPFLGDSVWLRTINGEPVIAVYEVFAKIVPSEGVIDPETVLIN